MNRLCFLRLAGALLAGFTGISLAAADEGLVRAEFIFESAPYPQVHASTVVETPRGLVAA